MARKTSSRKKKSYPEVFPVLAVTGASSGIGKSLVSEFVKDSTFSGRIIILDVHRPAIRSDRVEFFRVDLTRHGMSDRMADILRDTGCHTVVHLAFLHGPGRDESYAHELEVAGTRRLFRACSGSDVKKIIVTSTTAVYGASSRNPALLKENHDLGGNRSYRYVRDRIEVEDMSALYRDVHPGTIVTVLRFGTILGPTTRNVAAEYFDHLLIPTLVGYDPLVQFVHEDDAVRAVKAAVEKDCSGAYNIVGKGVLPLKTVISLMGRVNLPLPSSVAYPAASAFWFFRAAEAPGAHLDYVRYPCIADGEKAKHDLHFEPRFSTREAVLEFAGGGRFRRIPAGAAS